MAQQENVPDYAIVAYNTLTELATFLPSSSADLQSISGFGDYKVAKYGAAFLQTVNMYMELNHLEPRMHFKKAKPARKEKTEKPAKGSTMEASLQMFNDGLSVDEIAKQRKLSVTTIETHLASYAGTEDLDIHKLVPHAKLSAIIDAIKATGQTHAAKPVKDLLPDEYTYGEIKMALGFYKRLSSS
jgi:ATP-dependent DNA helicase RecQ